MRQLLTRAFVVAGLIVATAQGAGAVTIQEVNAYTRGQLWSIGAHLFGGASASYIAGDNGFFEEEIRNAFGFDLSAVTDEIVAASLLIALPANGFNSAQGTETYQLYDVHTPVGSLQTGGVASFVDVGTGAIYGTIVVTAADAGSILAIDLSAAAIADLNAALGGEFAIGGRLTTIDDTGGAIDETVFGFTHFSSVTGPRLVLATIPEPGTAALVLLGLIAFGLGRRR